MREVLQNQLMCAENFCTYTYTCTYKDYLLVGVVAVVLFFFFREVSLVLPPLPLCRPCHPS